MLVIKEEVDARALEDFLYEDSSDSSPDIGLHKAIRKPKPDKKPKSVKKSKPANRVETIGKTLPGGMLKPVSDLEPVDDLKDGGHRRSARLSKLVEEANSVEEHESIVKAETFEETGLAAVEMPKLGGLHEPIVKIELVESPDPLGTFKPIENLKSVEKLAPHTKSKPSRAPTPVAHSKLVEAAKPGEDAKEYQEMQPMRHFGVVFPDGIPWYIKTPTQVMSRTASDRKKEAARIHAHGFTVDKKCDKCKSQDYRCVAFDPFEKSFKAIKCARCVNLNIPCSLVSFLSD